MRNVKKKKEDAKDVKRLFNTSSQMNHQHEKVYAKERNKRATV